MLVWNLNIVEGALLRYVLQDRKISEKIGIKRILNLIFLQKCVYFFSSFVSGLLTFSVSDFSTLLCFWPAFSVISSEI